MWKTLCGLHVCIRASRAWIDEGDRDQHVGQPSNGPSKVADARGPREGAVRDVGTSKRLCGRTVVVDDHASSSLAAGNLVTRCVRGISVQAPPNVKSSLTREHSPRL